ncbi:hypothetical protein LDENG_00185480 [Lucifuga dentata]|nr:hypothetical protein LDENG_00185480 [Lucifuga dentata]
MKFGSAGRDSLDRAFGPSALPSTDRLGQKSSEVIFSTGSIAIIAVVSFLLLFLTVLILLIWRRRRGFCLDGKLDLANVIVDLDELQDPERNCELLSSLRRSSRRRQQLASCSSKQDVTDGVFLMVYLPSPYEHTLTRIARASSTSSSKDLELLPLSLGPETVNRGEEGGRRLEDETREEEKNQRLNHV